MNNDDIMLNCLMINFARALKDYCDNNTCNDCPFKNVDHGYGCRISTPAYWNIEGDPIDFPNSNKQTEDGSDPFVE